MGLVTLGLLNLSLLLRWGLGWALCLRMPALAAGVMRGQPSVAVLIPARDEEGTLPHLLRALEAQSFQPLSGLFWAAWCLPASLLGWPMLGDRSLATNLLLYGGFAAQLLVITRRVGSFGWINLIFPVPVLFFLGVFVLAIANLERGAVQWKGRMVSTRP